MQKPRLDKEWHLSHKMPKNPSHEERMKWHIAHTKHCACREIPPTLMREIQEYEKTKRREAHR